MHDAGFELAGVVAEVGEEVPRIQDLEPVDDAEKQRGLRLELADHLAKVIGAVPVENHELRYALRRE